MNKIVVACDSFKGCLSSIEIAKIVSNGIHDVCPSCQVVELPVADGGEGTVEALVEAMNGEMIETRVRGPLNSEVTARYGISHDGNTAFMEMASASGLPLLDPPLRNPLYTTTKGVGDMILDAIARGCRSILLGIGGSATNDCGMGMLIALGYKFFNQEGKEIFSGCGKDLENVSIVDDSEVTQEIRETRFVIACDVSNPLYGPNGAAYVYARQKGADDEMIVRLDKGMRHFAEIINRHTGREVAATPGAGAAGGLGYAFMAFLNANLKPGVDMVLDAINFDEIIKGADMVITGEGKIDRQTSMGKTPQGVMTRARRQQIPVIALGGSVEETEFLNNNGFTAIFPIQSGPLSLKEAMSKPTASANIKRTVTQIMRLLNI